MVCVSDRTTVLMQRGGGGACEHRQHLRGDAIAPWGRSRPRENASACVHTWAAPRAQRKKCGSGNFAKVSRNSRGRGAKFRNEITPLFARNSRKGLCALGCQKLLANSGSPGAKCFCFCYHITAPVRKPTRYMPTRSFDNHALPRTVKYSTPRAGPTRTTATNFHVGRGTCKHV